MTATVVRTFFSYDETVREAYTLSDLCLNSVNSGQDNRNSDGLTNCCFFLILILGSRHEGIL